MANQTIIETITQKFKNLSSKKPLIIRSPGRVNLIGEHTDYNEGFVLPAAVDKAIYVAIAKREDTKICLLSSEFNEQFECEIKDIAPTEKGWPNYVLGVVDQLIKNNHSITGFDLVFDGDVPIGAGMSSSAAIECAVVFALNHLFNLNIPKEKMVLMTQKAEHEYAGVKVGIMDMFASMFGKKDHVIKLDCRSITHEYVPLILHGYKLVLLNTNVKHSLASSAYNTRREQCEQGVAMVKNHINNVHSLRDVTMQMLDEYVQKKNPEVYKRCTYVVQENVRLLQACEDLIRGDINSLGKKMFETHDGLSKLYDVSCKELDFLVDHVRNNDAVLGARMMGGGFGGCTINLVKEEAIDELIKDTTKAYKESLQQDLTAYVVEIEEGTSIVQN
ncbi:MAG TPA: galactokinase [Chitinophagaceae bacterium]|nr:galactokinase [Chitinophagaceae bacterium]